MGADKSTESILGQSPNSIARIAGVFYLANIATSLFAFSGGAGHPSLAFASGYLATLCYVAVTVIFYFLFRPVSRSLSLAAAGFSLMGSAFGTLSMHHITPLHIHSLVFFGFYCLLIGYLIWRSTFLPRFLGALMVVAGFAWLTFLSRLLAHSLSPFNYTAGGIAEGSLTLWLLFAGVHAQRWKQQAGAVTMFPEIFPLTKQNPNRRTSPSPNQSPFF